MLVIRPEQMDVFRRQARLAFEREMLAHLQAFSPPLYEVTGPEQMLKVVRFGIDAAAAHGITFRGPVRLYLELMLLFGSRFDTDPQYPWVAEILGDGNRATQMQRANALYKKTLDYRREVVGWEDAHATAAYGRVAQMAERPVVVPLEELAFALLREIKDLYPEKAAYLGDAALTALIAAGHDAADKHGLSTVRGIRVTVGMMLLLGHGCLDDLLYPWISRTLNNETISDPEDRAGHLQRRALVWMGRVLTNLHGAPKT